MVISNANYHPQHIKVFGQYRIMLTLAEAACHRTIGFVCCLRIAGEQLTKVQVERAMHWQGAGRTGH